MPPKSSRSLAPLYASMIRDIQEVARDLGYAIALHGSMNRDLDIIAVPWTEDAKSEQILIESVRELFDGHIGHPNKEMRKLLGPQPEIRAHGRKAYSIYLSPHVFIDISVMPRMEISDGEKSNDSDG